MFLALQIFTSFVSSYKRSQNNDNRDNDDKKPFRSLFPTPNPHPSYTP